MAARRDLAWLLAVCLLMFGWQLGRLGLIDPDEPFYAQSATEMLAHHDWITPQLFGHAQFEKPILFYWLEMVTFATLGRTELAARLPAAVFGTALVLLTYLVGARRFGRGAGRLAALVLATGALFAGASRFVLTDIVFAFFACACGFACMEALSSERPRPGLWLLASASSGLAVLTKGPLGLLIPLLAAAAFAWAARWRPRPSARLLLGAIGLHLAIAAPWYGVMLARFRGDYLRAFFLHENVERFLFAEHPSNNHMLYYVAVLVAGSLPWIPGLAVALGRVGEHARAGRATRYLLCWIGGSLAFFTAAQSKLPTYILFLFPPVALIVGVTLDALMRTGFRNAVERRVAVAAAVFQAVAVVGALAFPPARAFGFPLGVGGAGLAVAAVLLGRGLVAPWIAATAVAIAATFVCLLSGAAAPLDEQLSMKPVAALLQKSVAQAEPVLASPMLVRGLTYYSGRPGLVWTSRSRPFWTYPEIPLIVGPSGLSQFVAREGAARCVLRSREWQSLAPQLPRGMVGETVVIGDRVVVRLVRAPAPGSPGPRQP